MNTIYPLLTLALSQIRVFRSRADFKLLFGKDAPPPDLTRTPKNWIDMDVLNNPTNYGFRVTYSNVLSLAANGQPLLVDSSLEPDPGRRAFYAGHPECKLVPTFDLLQLMQIEAASVNLPPDGGINQSDTALAAWGALPTIPFPCRALNAGEAFFPVAAFGWEVVDMAAYASAAQSASGTDPISAKLDQVLALCGRIATATKA